MTKIKTKKKRFVIKANTHGAFEAFKAAIEALASPEFDVEVIYDGIQDVTASNVEFARVGECEIIGFEVNATPDVKAIMKSYGITFKPYKII